MRKINPFKPHIRYSRMYEQWMCTAIGSPPFLSARHGWGMTCREAYENYMAHFPNGYKKDMSPYMSLEKNGT